MVTKFSAGPSGRGSSSPVATQTNAVDTEPITVIGASGPSNSHRQVLNPSRLNPEAPVFRSFQSQTPRISNRFRPRVEDVEDEDIHYFPPNDPEFPQNEPYHSPPSHTFWSPPPSPSQGSSIADLPPSTMSSTPTTPTTPRNYRGVPPQTGPNHQPVAYPYTLFGAPAMPNSHLPGFQDTGADLRAAAHYHRTAESDTTRQNAVNQSFLARDRPVPGFNSMAQSTGNQSHSGHEHVLPGVNTTARDASFQPSKQESMYSSIYPGGGVSVSGTDNSTPIMLQHQTHNFSQLASKQRVRDWNNLVFDDRWVRSPTEIYHSDSRPHSASKAELHRQAVSNRGERPSSQRVTYQPLSQQNRDGNNTRVEGSTQEPLNFLPSTRYHPGKERGSTRNMDQNSNAFLGYPEPRQSTGTGLDGALEPYSAYMAHVHSAEERRKERERVVPTPPEAARMAACVHELDKLSEFIPLHITEPTVVYRYLCERVFHESLPTPIRGPEGDTLTKHDGKLITLRALRDRLLADMDDVVAYVLSPAGEDFRLRAKERLASSPAEGTDSTTSARSDDYSPSHPSDEQIASGKDHNSNLTHLQPQEETSFDMGMSINQRRGLKPKTTIEEAVTRRNIYIDRHDSLDKHHQGGFEEKDTMRKAHVERVGASTERTSPQTPINEPRAEAEPGQIGPQPFLPFGVPAQFRYGAYPGMAFTAPGYYGQMPQVQQPWAQQHWAFQQRAAPVQHPAFAANQPMTYGYPVWQQTFSQPVPGYSATPHSLTAQSGYVPPPMPFGVNTVVRPAAGARVARLFAEKLTPQDPMNVQTRELPSAITQNTEWQNRYGPQPSVVPDVPVLPYLPGSDTMFPRSTGTASVQYQNLTREDPPSLHMATAEENVPFAENSRNCRPGKWGVVKIGNIPYDLTKAALVNFLGPHAKIITADLGPAVHIIMDRSTGKTMDCFVEFFSTPDANACVNSFNLRPVGQNRIGDRFVDIILSSQDELMRELFPKAKNVTWVGAKPVVHKPIKGEMFNTGFKTFVSSEELGCLVRHAEQPHRSNYTQRSPQRTYEALISLVAKFPWSSVDNYTLATRTQIYQATRQMLHILSINVRKSYIAPVTAFSSLSMHGGGQLSHGGMPLLTEQLLKDLLMAGLNAPGFSEKQRWELFELTDCAKFQFRVSPLLQHWPFEALGRKPHMEDDVIELYSAIISSSPITTHPNPDASFGSLHTVTENVDLDSQTMGKVSEMEKKMLFAMVEAYVTGDMGDGMDDVWAWSHGGPIMEDE